MNNTVNFNTITPQVRFAKLSDENTENTDKTASQVSFAGKGNGVLRRIIYRKQGLKEQQKLVDSFNDKAVELLNKDRPIEEQKERAIRKSLEWIFKKLGFGKKLRNAGEKKVKKIDTNDNVQNFKLDEGVDLMKQSLTDIGNYFKKNNIV